MIEVGTMVSYIPCDVWSNVRAKDGDMVEVQVCGGIWEWTAISNVVEVGVSPLGQAVVMGYVPPAPEIVNPDIGRLIIETLEPIAAPALGATQTIEQYRAAIEPLEPEPPAPTPQPQGTAIDGISGFFEGIGSKGLIIVGIVALMLFSRR